MAEIAENLKALLQVINQQKEMIQNLQKQSSSKTISSNNDLMETLSNSMQEFCYDPDNGVTFKSWYAKYEDLLLEDGAKLDEKTRVRLIVRKLCTKDHQKYINYILPKTPKDFGYDETIKKLKSIFDRQDSLFSLRHRCLESTKNPNEDFLTYASRVNKACEDFQVRDLKVDQFKCLIYVMGLSSSEDSDIRTRLLSRLDSEEDLSLEKLVQECQRLKNLKTDNKLVESSCTKVNQEQTVFAVKSNRKNQKKSDKKPTKNNRTNGDLPRTPCWQCGEMHFSRDCKFTDHVCTQCNVKGHKEGYCSCYKPKNKNTSSSDSKKHDRKQSSKNNKSNVVKTINVTTIESKRKFVDVTINSVPITLQVDTASDVTIVSTNTWRKLGSPTLTQPSEGTNDASGNLMTFIGEFTGQIKFRNQTTSGKIFVISSNEINLLGLDFIDEFKLLDQPLNTICNLVSSSDQQQSSIQSLKEQFPKVFCEKLGHCTKQVTLHLKPNAIPVYCPARPVAYAFQPKIEMEIKRLQMANIITPISFSEWAAPIVSVRKSNGSIRFCADYSTGLNNALQPHDYPLPRAEDIFSKLSGNIIFSHIDLSDAYFQLEVDDASKELLPINTHRGLYRMNRLSQGVKPASGIFQQMIDTILAGIEGVSSFVDDIIVAGKTDHSHIETLKKVLQRLEEFGFTVKIEKCKFFKSQLQYLGYILDSSGLRPDPSKIEAIVNMDPPQNVSQLRSLLGSINFYGKFVPNMREIRAPLDHLLKKDVEFEWSKDCKRSFDKFKEILSSNLLLTHFNPDLPIVVAADASQNGLGACIMHTFPDATTKPIHHASRSLTDAETRYSQIEKEGLGLIFAVTKFHRYIFGRKFTLQTDHKPLISIFGSKKGIPIQTANRLQRWALTLMNYDFDIKYVSTHDFGYVDVLSRLTNSHKTLDEDLVVAAIRAAEDDLTAIIQNTVNNLPITFKMIETATQNDETLKTIIDYVNKGWPPKKNLKEQETVFYNRRDSLLSIGGALMFDERIVIPSIFHGKILKCLHRGHPGISSMKHIARSFVYWPGIDSSIQNYVKACESCQSMAKSPTKSVLHSWPVTTHPWQRAHADFAGPYHNTNFFVIVDSFTKWPEVFIMQSITTSATIDKLRECFARHGNFQSIVTDNGTTFTSGQFASFCEERGVQHLRTAPYHPQSNGLAERFVDTLKRSLGKMRNEGNMNEILQTFLQMYRSTPNLSSTHRVSPAEALYGRPIKTTIALVKPQEEIPPQRNIAQENQFNRKHGAKPREFRARDWVNVQQYVRGKVQWCKGTVIERKGSVLYNVWLPQSQKLIRCHVNQMIARNSDDDTNNDDGSNSNRLPLSILLNDFGIANDVGNQPTNDANSSNEDYISISSTDESDTHQQQLPERSTRPVRQKRRISRYQAGRY